MQTEFVVREEAQAGEEREFWMLYIVLYYYQLIVSIHIMAFPIFPGKDEHGSKLGNEDGSMR